MLSFAMAYKFKILPKGSKSAAEQILWSEFPLKVLNH